MNYMVSGYLVVGRGLFYLWDVIIFGNFVVHICKSGEKTESKNRPFWYAKLRCVRKWKYIEQRKTNRFLTWIGTKVKVNNSRMSYDTLIEKARNYFVVSHKNLEQHGTNWFFGHFEAVTNGLPF